MREQSRCDVCDEDRRKRQQDVLDAVGAPAEDDRSDEHGCRGNGGVASDAGEVEARSDSGELGARRAEVRDDESRRDHERGPMPVRAPNEADEARAGGEPESCAELVEDDEGRDRDDEDSEQLVAVAGADDRVRRDAGGIVVGEAGQETGPQHAEEHGQPEGSSERRFAVPAGELLDADQEHAVPYFLPKRCGIWQIALEERHNLVDEVLEAHVVTGCVRVDDCVDKDVASLQQVVAEILVAESE